MPDTLHFSALHLTQLYRTDAQFRKQCIQILKYTECTQECDKQECRYSLALFYSHYCTHADA